MPKTKLTVANPELIDPYSLTSRLFIAYRLLINLMFVVFLLIVSVRVLRSLTVLCKNCSCLFGLWVFDKCHSQIYYFQPCRSSSPSYLQS